MVRQRFAKPSYAGSNPVLASGEMTQETGETPRLGRTQETARHHAIATAEVTASAEQGHGGGTIGCGGVRVALRHVQRTVPPAEVPIVGSQGGGRLAEVRTRRLSLSNVPPRGRLLRETPRFSPPGRRRLREGHRDVAALPRTIEAPRSWAIGSSAGGNVGRGSGLRLASGSRGTRGVETRRVWAVLSTVGCRACDAHTTASSPSSCSRRPRRHATGLARSSEQVAMAAQAVCSRRRPRSSDRRSRVRSRCRRRRRGHARRGRSCSA